jgi:hypothetical protein
MSKKRTVIIREDCEYKESDIIELILAAQIRSDPALNNRNIPEEAGRRVTRGLKNRTYIYRDVLDDLIVSVLEGMGEGRTAKYYRVLLKEKQEPYTL